MSLNNLIVILFTLHTTHSAFVTCTFCLSSCVRIISKLWGQELHCTNYIQQGACRYQTI